MELIGMALIFGLISQAAPAAAGIGLTVVQLLLTALAPSGLATFLTALYMRRKIRADTGHVDADAVQILTNTSVSLLEPMKQQIGFLTEQLTKANQQITELKALVETLNTKLEKYENDHGDVVD